MARILITSFSDGLGKLAAELSGKMPHPKGEIRVSYNLKSNPTIEIQLPGGISACLVFKGKSYPL